MLRQALDEMKNLYIEIERLFLEFNEIIPYSQNSENQQIYSPRLVALIQTIGPQIDGMAKTLIQIFQLKPESNSIPAHFKALNTNNMLSVQEIQFRETLKPRRPFSLDSDNNTKWWRAYNQSKHDLPYGIYAVNYGYVIDALAALAILHELVIISQRWGDGAPYLKSEYWSKATITLESVQYYPLTNFARDNSKVFVYPMVFSPIEPIFK